MSVVRVRKRSEHPYVQLERATLRISTLSLKARGLWAICMSHPDDWEFRIGHLAGISEHDGEHAVRSALKELDSHDLARLRDLREDDGTLSGKRWSIYENPALCIEEDAPTDMGKTATSVPTDVAVNRRPENPDVGVITPNVLESKEESLESSSTESPQREPLQMALVQAPEPPAAAASSQEDLKAAKNEAYQLLLARGLDTNGAYELAKRYHERVAPLVARFDAETRHARRIFNPTPGPGWLAKAIREDWPADQRPGAPPPAVQAATHTGRLPEAERAMQAQRKIREEDAQRPESGPRKPKIDVAAAMEAERQATLRQLEARGAPTPHSGPAAKPKAVLAPREDDPTTGVKAGHSYRTSPRAHEAPQPQAPDNHVQDS